MKKVYVSLLVIVLLAFMTIVGIVIFNKNNTEVYQLNEKIKLYKGDSIKVDNIIISLISISDSTCPNDAQCIWPGEYSYELIINEDKITLGSVKNREVKYDDYNITLLDDTSNKFISFKMYK